MPSTYYTCPECEKPIEANFAIHNEGECYHEDCPNFVRMVPEPEEVAPCYCGWTGIDSDGCRCLPSV
jgi:hypothetical protein